MAIFDATQIIDSNIIEQAIGKFLFERNERYRFSHLNIVQSCEGVYITALTNTQNQKIYQKLRNVDFHVCSRCSVNRLSELLVDEILEMLPILEAQASMLGEPKPN